MLKFHHSTKILDVFGYFMRILFYIWHILSQKVNMWNFSNRLFFALWDEQPGVREQRQLRRNHLVRASRNLSHRTAAATVVSWRDDAVVNDAVAFDVTSAVGFVPLGRPLGDEQPLVRLRLHAVPQRNDGNYWPVDNFIKHSMVVNWNSRVLIKGITVWTCRKSFF